MSEEAGTYELVKPKPAEALIEVEQQRAIAETQGAMIIAKRFPRDTIAATDRIVNACTRPGLAEAALYEYSRGGTAITGPSIRLAEAIAQNWGNLQFGIRELEQRAGVSTVEAFAWDIETNVREVKIFQVTHKRYTKKGTYALEDPRDIYEMVANQGARRLRSCILGIIPGDVVETAVKQCDTTLKTKAAVTPERIASLLEKFGEFNVTKEQIEKRIQRHVDAMTPAQMVNLGKIYNSLKDGMSSPVDWFEVQEGKQDEPKSKMDSLKDKLKGEPDPKPQSPPENAAAPGGGDAEEGPPPETTQPQDTKKPPKAKTLFENLMAARGTFCHMVLDNGDLIQNLPPDELRAVKERWAKASAQGIGGVTKGDPWPIKEKKEETPLFEIEEEGEKTEEAPADPFLAKVEEYRKELDPNAWELILKISGMAHTPISEIPEGEPRVRFLERCSRSLDQQNAKVKK